MRYQETLDYLFTRLPMYQRIGSAAYKKDLTNTLKLCSILHEPQEKFRSIHIAGTNGKGSVSNMLASILAEAGYKTGLYTSPHLLDFRERIRVNGELCTRQFIMDFTEKMKPHIESVEPSFFEITVAMAFDYFAEQQADIAVIETGLGGRLDSTNVITPLLSVITNISFDHMHMLGDSLAAIAGEKAGIIKKGIPVVIGEFQEEAFPVFLEQANTAASPLYLAEENFDLEILDQSLWQLVLNASYLNQLIYENLACDLTATYQLKNIKTVLQAVEILRNQNIEISDEAVYDGLKNSKKNTGFTGRMQVISKEPLILCDCAHNAAGLRALFEQISTLPHRGLRIVTGMVNDKDPALSLQEFPQNATYYFCKPAIPRGLHAAELKNIASGYALYGSDHASVKDAMRAAFQEHKKNDIILICGSIFVVAEALQNTDSVLQ